MVFLDTNILLEIILKDRDKSVQVEKYLENLNEATVISMLSVHLIMYFGRKEQADDSLLESMVRENELIALTPEDYDWALTNGRKNDFEDALQVAVAIRSGCNTFVTLDKKLARAYTDLPIRFVVV